MTLPGIPGGKDFSQDWGVGWGAVFFAFTFLLSPMTLFLVEMDGMVAMLRLWSRRGTGPEGAKVEDVSYSTGEDLGMYVVTPN